MNLRLINFYNYNITGQEFNSLLIGTLIILCCPNGEITTKIHVIIGKMKCNGKNSAKIVTNTQKRLCILKQQIKQDLCVQQHYYSYRE